MTKKQCPLGDARDLTTAWMAGIQHGIDWLIPIIEAKDAEIERLRGDLAKAVESLGRISDGESWQANEARDTLAELTGGKP